MRERLLHPFLFLRFVILRRKVGNGVRLTVPARDEFRRLRLRFDPGWEQREIAAWQRESEQDAERHMDNVIREQGL